MSGKAKVGGWSNPSVLSFANGDDPISAAAKVAARLRERAQELGLAGPPIDVLGLARAEGIGLRPVNEIADAQIDIDGVDESGGLTISYNPSRPRGRLRFNIAHELAHAQFPDVGEQLRQRTPLGAVESSSSDSWELEFICNLIASDILMPVDGMEGVANSGTDIDFLMEFRRRWDVSTEAILRRYVTLARRRVTLIAATRISDAEARIDYAYSSSEVEASDPMSSLGHGSKLSGADVLTSIAAVGQTLRGEVVIGSTTYRVQAVGVPPYPASKRARILALVEPIAEPDNPRIEHVVSDLVDIDDENVLFVHVASDSVRAWSRVGVGARLAARYPDLATSYRMWTLSDPGHLQLGEAHIVGRPDGERQVAVATLVAQEGFGVGRGQIRYDALAAGLQRVRHEAERTGAVVHVPRLGAGQAGGRWDVIEGLLDEGLAAHGIRVIVHTKPQQGVTR